MYKYIGIAFLSAALVFGGITKFSSHHSARAQTAVACITPNCG
jgi:hypothetical protein